MDEDEQPYMVTKLPDGSIKLEGPLHPETLKNKMKKEKNPTVAVTAKTKGNAMLKILSNVINSEK